MKKKVYAILCLFILMASLCGCSFHQQKSISEFAKGEGVYIAYNQLSASEKEIYDKILTRLVAGETYFWCEADYLAEGNSIESVEHAITAIYNDRPEFFWLEASLGNITYIDSKQDAISVVAGLRYYYEHNLTKLDEDKVSFAEAVNNIVNQAMAFPDTFSRVEYVYEYLCSNVTCGDDVYYNSGYKSGEVYDCIVNNTTNLKGCAKAFQLIMQRLGIPCATVEGYTKARHLSTWNYLLIDGDYYYVAFDSLISRKHSVGVSHEYFLIDEKTLLDTHVLTAEHPHPSCNGYKMNYFFVKDAYISEYSFESMGEYINQANDMSYIEVRFTSKKELQKAYSDLVEEERALELPGFERGFTYSVSLSGYVLRIASK